MGQQRLRELWSDTTGSAANSVLSLAAGWTVVGSVFLCNTQLGVLHIKRDAVDHSAATAADVAGKTFCAKRGPGAEAAARRSVEPVLSAVGTPEECRVEVKQTGISVSAGRNLEVCVRCHFACRIPFASSLLCEAGAVDFEKCQPTVAMGCDAK